MIRYKENMDFDTPGIAETLSACESLPLTDKFGILTILPAEGGLDLDAMQEEHSTEGMSRRVIANAMVVKGELFRRLTEIHYTYHPQHFEVRVFTDAEEARAWVRASLDEASSA